MEDTFRMTPVLPLKDSAVQVLDAFDALVLSRDDDDHFMVAMCELKKSVVLGEGKKFTSRRSMAEDLRILRRSYKSLEYMYMQLADKLSELGWRRDGKTSEWVQDLPTE